MASLYRLDVMVRESSDISEPDAIKWTKDWVNDRQEADDNKYPDGSYKRDYYSDLFDSRTGKIWKVFSDVAADNRDIDDSYDDIEGVMYISIYIEKLIDLETRVDNNSKEIADIKVIVNDNNAEIL